MRSGKAKKMEGVKKEMRSGKAKKMEGVEKKIRRKGE